MSALAEALVAAQARAIAVLGKTYLSVDPETAAEMRSNLIQALNDIGATDKIEQVQLICCWDALRAAGAQAPPEAKQIGPDRSKATDAQISLMRKIAGERNYTMPDDPQILTRDHASQVIDSMKAGEYDYNEWRVPI